MFYLPPPAHAQAQPAHAQAQAHPPLDRPPLLETTGGGLVTWVTPPVKLSKRSTMPPAVRSMLLTTVPAKAAPGSVGKVTDRPPPLLLRPVDTVPPSTRELAT